MNGMHACWSIGAFAGAGIGALSVAVGVCLTTQRPRARRGLRRRRRLAHHRHAQDSSTEPRARERRGRAAVTGAARLPASRSPRCCARARPPTGRRLSARLAGRCAAVAASRYTGFLAMVAVAASATGCWPATARRRCCRSSRPPRRSGSRPRWPSPVPAAALVGFFCSASAWAPSCRRRSAPPADSRRAPRRRGGDGVRLGLGRLPVRAAADRPGRQGDIAAGRARPRAGADRR